MGVRVRVERGHIWLFGGLVKGEDGEDEDV